MAEATLAGGLPAMTCAVSTEDVAPFGALPLPCPLATRLEKAATPPVRASSDAEAADSAELVGGA